MAKRILASFLRITFVAQGLGTGVRLKGQAPPANNIAQVPLDNYFNNQAFGLSPGEASFDQAHQAYPASQLPPGPTYESSTGFGYLFPGYQGPNKSDNVLCAGQRITVTQQKYFSLQMLVSAENSTASGNVTLLYSDNTTTVSELRSQNWYKFLGPPKGEIILPSRLTHNDTNWNTSHIYEWFTAVNPHKDLVGLNLPDTSNSTSRLHVFSMSLLKTGSGLEIQQLRPTQKWTADQLQVIEVTINNAGDEWVLGDGITVEISAPGLATVEKGSVKRLMPGDQKKVAVAVSGSPKNVTAQVKISGMSANMTVDFPEVSFGLETYTEDLKSLTLHESPDWFNDAKFGIFIHWGVYSVPGWGNSTPYEVYAEWYGWYGHSNRVADKADVHDYHLRTYGPIPYDDFISNFTASKWDPKDWVDLISDAGAMYWVLTTKHHDGFALFDTENTSNRNSLVYGPKRDIVEELFNASTLYQPHLRRGTYFSLPEWWNPAYGKYGMTESDDPASTNWLGIPATNPYTGAVEPYTGLVNVSDFITDLMVPQMNALAYKYKTDIMWCDCGGANGTAMFASAWYNQARAEGRQVTMNSRCGIPEGSDFDTPEYQTFSSVSPRKWESNQGMDPYSYGYNRATPENLYMNASTIVTTLIDMVSKNGNLLLDFGPKADGTIDETEVAHLRAAGKWIKANAESIFNTTYWFITSEEGSDIRFTQSASAFYIHFLTRPSVNTLLTSPIPLLDTDKLVMIGAGNDSEVSWRRVAGGIEVEMPEKLAVAGEFAWVLRLMY